LRFGFLENSLKGKDGQGQQEFIKGRLIFIFMIAFRNTILKFRMGYG